MMAAARFRITPTLQRDGPGSSWTQTLDRWAQDGVQRRCAASARSHSGRPHMGDKGPGSKSKDKKSKKKGAKSEDKKQ
ncbi:MAG: hypothetical protein ACR2GO_05890 [Candidatus Limnocylindria bacterium]